jgi:hypothetical protein
MTEWPADGGRRALAWHCDPPPRGVPFLVTQEGWAFRDGREIREIRAIAPLDDKPADGSG